MNPRLRLRRFRQFVEYLAVRGAMWMAGALPLPLASAIGAGVGRCAFDVVRMRREVSVDNITRALGVPAGDAAAIARASYANLGRSFMEFAAFRHLDRRRLLASLDFEGLEHLERVREAGKGGILASGHTGHWELWPAALVARGFPVDSLVGQQTNERIDDVMNDLRRRQGAEIITRTGALRKVMQSLAQGRFVALLFDQDARKGGVMVEFLGRPASTVRGPALFAVRRGCPVVPIFIVRENGRHRVVIEPPLYPVSGLDEDAAVLDLTRRCTDRLTDHVRRHPSEYFWPHRRWKTSSIAQA
jgi:KDO2-lipid IV(A) lauroyltransferase